MTPTPTSGKSAIGLDSHVTATIAYLGGILSGIFLLMVEKDDRYVRFHAMQSTIVFLIVLVVHFVLLGVPVIGWILVHAVHRRRGHRLWVFLMFKAFHGETYKLPYLGDLAEQQLKT